MLKLNLDMLVVDSFATTEMPRHLRGTIEGRQHLSDLTSFPAQYATCNPTCDSPSCRDPSCRDTECVTACQGGGELTREGCAGGGGGGGGTGGDGGGTGTDYIGCTNDCTTGMQTAT